MTKQETEQIIDTINQLSDIATNLLDTGNLQPDDVFSQIKPYLGLTAKSPCENCRRI